jgi:hypothetical protein
VGRVEAAVKQVPTKLQGAMDNDATAGNSSAVETFDLVSSSAPRPEPDPPSFFPFPLLRVVTNFLGI